MAAARISGTIQCRKILDSTHGICLDEAPIVFDFDGKNASRYEVVNGSIALKRPTYDIETTTSGTISLTTDRQWVEWKSQDYENNTGKYERVGYLRINAESLKRPNHS